MKSGISIAYSGVHQAYQLALAAHEMDELERFYCSLFAAPGKWGGLLEKLLGAGALHNRTMAGLPRDKISEIPWPLVAHRCRAKLARASTDDWSMANSWFDRSVARDLHHCNSAVFVGVETCAAESFATARGRGMIRVLDCPGIDAEFLSQLALRTADEFGLTTTVKVDCRSIREMKARELQLADTIFVCSDLQARLVRTKRQPPHGVHVLPLWVATNFWQPSPKRESDRSGPLRVLFAGKISLRKGVPYLLRAAAQCVGQIELTLVGPVADEVTPLLKQHAASIRLFPPCVKSELRSLYQRHDLLALPSLGDSFGFVAMEAMACGLPVIVTENCGVSVPDPNWRVPVMSSEAIAKRLTLYARDRELCRDDGRRALEFARQFSPERYRQRVKKIFAELLAPAVTQVSANVTIVNYPVNNLPTQLAAP